MSNIFNSRNPLKHSTPLNPKPKIMGKRLFGNKMGRHGKDFGFSKKFRGNGKSTEHTISPSVGEFNKMMSKIAGHQYEEENMTLKKKKKSLYNKK